MRCEKHNVKNIEYQELEQKKLARQNEKSNVREEEEEELAQKSNVVEVNAPKSWKVERKLPARKADQIAKKIFTA